jgi:GxxExxY protein
LSEKQIPYEREKLLSATGIDKNKADFLINNKIILEVKAMPYPTRKDYYQVRRYLRLRGLKLGIIVNFRQRYLRPKRILNPEV